MNKPIEKADVEREKHALDSIVIVEDHTKWEDKLRQWEGPMTFEDRLSWLHTNHVREGNGPEKFVFFLELADKYGESGLFEKLPGHKKCIFADGTFQSVTEFKSRLAKRAFAILCNAFFSNEATPCPFYLPYKDPLFSKLLWFFRPFGGHGGWDNLRPRDEKGLAKDGGRHYLQVAKSYAERFVLDAWEILNHHWYKSCDGDEPNPKVAEPHWREIVTLVRHLDMLDNIERGQYIPIPSVFKKMVGMVLKENGIAYMENILGDMTIVGMLLAPLVKKGDPLARSLDVARLNVNDYDHSEFRI